MGVQQSLQPGGISPGAPPAGVAQQGQGVAQMQMGGQAQPGQNLGPGSVTYPAQSPQQQQVKADFIYSPVCGWHLCLLSIIQTYFNCIGKEDTPPLSQSSDRHFSVQ